MLETFKTVDPVLLDQGTSLNIDAYRDQFSPYSHVHTITLPETESSGLWIDPNYGLVYGDWIGGGGGFYGITDLMPGRSFDEIADLGFLRVPFGRFPRMKVRSRADTESLLTRARAELAPGGKLLLRGQTREYDLNRPRAVREALYGSGDVIEPSLLTSASRHGVDINALMPEWSGLLRFMLDVVRPRTMDEELRGLLHHWYHSYSFSRFAFAVAQHYGLPSSGLDVTPDLSVALFFALRKLTVLSEEDAIASYVAKEDWAQPSVVYVFQVPTQWHTFSYESVRLSRLPTLRPERQDAYFLHRGWGWSANDCARSLLFAMYFDENFDAGELPDATHLFPSEKEDPFAAGLAALRKTPILTPALQAFLRHLYFLAELPPAEP